MLISTIVLLYLILLILISIYHRFTKKNIYKIQTKFTGATYIFGASVGGTTIFGITNKAYLLNLEYCLGLIICIATFDVFFSIVIYPKIREKLVNISVGQLMYEKYGNIGKVMLGIAACTVTLGYLAAQMNVLIQICQHILLIPKTYACIFFVLYIMLYNLITPNNVKRSNLYFFVLTSAILLLAFCMMKQIGGLNTFVYFAKNQYKQLDLIKLIKDSIILTVGFACLNLNPATIKRTSMLSKKNLIKSCLIKVSISIILIFILTLNGYMANILLSGNEINSNIVSWIITNVLPYYGQIFVTLGIISAVLMNTDADLQAINHSVKTDILKTYKIFNKISCIRHINLLITTIAVIIATIIALIFNDVLDIILVFIGAWFPYFGILIIASLYDIFLNKKMLIIDGVLITSIFILITILFPEKKFLGAIVASFSNLMVFFAYAMFIKIKSIITLNSKID